MTYSIFLTSLEDKYPPNDLGLFLKALWYDAKGDWERAHTIVDREGGPVGDWIHAYLHRVEGDQWNADYWYRRAGRDRPSGTLQEEWESIVKELLGQ